MNSSVKPVVRFAPSPTGRIHIGNARTALINYFHAKKSGGTFILRFDDTDVARSTREFADGIEEDLRWLGSVPDRIHRQSERFDLYAAAADKLRAAGKLYACYETEDELTYRRNRLRAQHKPPIYDRAALKLTGADRAALEAQGRRPHWRFLLDHRAVTWRDGVRGDQTIDCASLSDPVLVRADGTYLYTLPSVVDDIDMSITDVIRGEDHVTNTAVQIQLCEALGGTPPRYAHHNLLTKPDGKGLSKRDGDLALAMLRDAGMEPTAVAAVAVLTGTSHAVEPVATLGELMDKFDLASVSHSSAKFDPVEIAALNARTLHLMPFDAVASRLAALGIGGGAAFWDAVRGNLSLFRDAAIWWDVVSSHETYTSGDGDLVRAAIDLLPAEPWNDTTWSGWTKAVAASSGKKGRALFHPLRLALTGREQGPELKLLLPLIGRARALARLEAAAR